jgi:hypothetical protein
LNPIAEIPYLSPSIKFKNTLNNKNSKDNLGGWDLCSRYGLNSQK